MSKTLSDAQAELEQVVSVLLDVAVDDFAGSRMMRWILRANDWADRQPVIGPIVRLLDRAPAWMKAGTREWFTVVGVLWLVIAVALVLAVAFR